MLSQGCEMTPLEVLWTLDPVSRHEVHGSLEGRLETLWRAVEKHLEVLGKPSTATETMEAQQAVFAALYRLNKHAEETLNFHLNP